MAKRRTGIQPLSPKVDREIRGPVEKMREVLEVGLGQRGSPRDQFLTFGDLLDTGLVKLVGSGSVYLPGENLIATPEIPNPVVPPTPQNFIVTGGFSHILLEWSPPNAQYLGHAYTTIYRSVTDDFGTAEEVGQTTSFVWADLNVVREQTYYYWIAFTSESGIEGPINATNGTAGQTAPDPALVLDSLSGQITETELYADLNERINLIDTPGTGLIDSLAGETLARQTAVSDLSDDVNGYVSNLQQQIDGLVVASAIEIFYQTAEPVDADASGGTLTEGSRWFDTDDNNRPYIYHAGTWKDARDQLAVSVQSSLNTEIVNRQTADSAQVLRLDALEATVDDPANGVIATANALSGLTTTVTNQGGSITAISADITSIEAQLVDLDGDVAANASANSSLATRVTTAESDIVTLGQDYTNLSGLVTAESLRIDSLESDLTNAEGTIAGTSTALDALTTRVSTAEGLIDSQATSITSLQSGLGSANTSISGNASAIQTLQTRVTDTEDSYDVLSEDVTALQGSMTNAESGIAANASGLSSLTTRVTAAEGSISTQSDALTQLQSDITNINTGLGANSTAISSLRTRVDDTEDGIATNATAIEGLESTINDSETGLVATASAVGVLETSVSNLDGEVSSQATQLNQLSTTVGQHTASIQTQAESIDGLGGSYSVKIDNNGHVAGYGLSSTTNTYDGSIHSQMLFSVNRFAVASPGASSMSFVVDGGRVVMDGALIKNASIGSAQVGSLSADKLTGVDATFLLGKIGTGNITNAYIGDVIQSSNYSGSAGWHINKNGNAIFRNIYARGDIEADKLKANAANIVETIHLRGEAVTVGGVANFDGRSVANGNTSKTTLGSLNFNAAGGTVMVNIYCQMDRVTNTRFGYIGLYVDGTQFAEAEVRGSSSSWEEVPVALSYAVSGKNSVTIEVKGWSTYLGVQSQTPICRDGTLLALGFKR